MSLPRLEAGEGLSARERFPETGGLQRPTHDHDSCAPRRVDGARPRVRSASGCRTSLPKLVLAPSFLLVLIFVYGFNLWTLFLSFTNSKALRLDQARRPRQLPEALELDLRDRSAVELVHGDRQYGHFRRALCRLLPGPRPDAGDPARPEDPRRRHSAPDLSLSARAVVHRHRARRGSCFSIRASGSKRRSTIGAGRASSSTGSSIRG